MATKDRKTTVDIPGTEVKATATQLEKERRPLRDLFTQEWKANRGEVVERGKNIYGINRFN